jgi:hypothetical protein
VTTTPPVEVQSALKTLALVGFLITATLIVGINFKIFTGIFKGKVTSYWWLFLVVSAVPILMALYLYSFFFGGKA